MEREKGVALITSLMVLLLISAIVVGMCWMVMTDQRLGGNNQSRELAFYGAEAGMEKMTTDVANTFSVKGALGAADIATIVAAPPNALPGIQYLNAAGASTYQITPLVPVSNNATILPPSPYAGMQGLITPFTLTVAAQNTATGAEVKLTRQVQVVSIPVFQFGIYSDSDVAFFNGPSFQFGGRTHTNGNLWLAPNDGPLFLGDKVTAVGQVIRTNLENGTAGTNGSTYGGYVSIATSPNPSLTNEPGSEPYTNSSWRQLDFTEGSVTGTSVYGNISTNLNNPTWSGTVLSAYNGQVQNGVPVLSLTSTALGGITSPISLIRRAVPGELAANPAEFGEQYFSEATLRILLDDYPAGVTPGAANACNTADMMSLDTVTATPPTDLATLAFPSDGSTTGAAPAWYTGASNSPAGALFPLPVSGAAGGTTYSATDGYWLKSSGTTNSANNGKASPTILGCIKIEYQNLTGAWTDVTTTILNMGFSGRDIAPTGTYKGSDGATNIAYAYPGSALNLPTLPTGSAVGFPAQGPSPAGTALATIPAGCTDPSPNAIIRLERVRDNPSYMGAGGLCTTAITKTNFVATDFWPLALYDSREGMFRQVNVQPGVVAAGGVMYYVELDAKNLATWLSGQQGTLSLNNNTGGYTVYFSDRRGEQPDTQNGGGLKTGSYGFNDFVNLNDAANGCPNGTLDPPYNPPPAPSQGEDLEGDGVLRTYGGVEKPPTPLTSNIDTGLWNALNYMNTVLVSNANCGAHPNRPDVTYSNPQEARENAPVYFRRALKIVDGATLNLGTTCGAVPCGLTIAAENPVYIQGDYNAPVDNGTWTGASVAAAVVGDAVTFLSNNWNDVNTFVFPQDIVQNKIRNAVPTAYRAAIIGGKGIPFQQIGSTADFGTDGGVHNFLRFLEYWGVNCYYEGSMVSFYYNRQAVGTYKGSGVYSPPNRLYSFDQNFALGPAYLPPRTPQLRSVNTIGFSQEILPTQ
jgi:Tfp pilus assembly protein PilX